VPFVLAFRESVSMPEIVAWHGGEPAEVLSRAVGALAEGRLVALPTESTYELAGSALAPAAVARLREAAGGAEPVAVVLTGSAEALDWLPQMNPLGRRLLRKFGPGDWKLIADGGAELGLLGRLPEPVRETLCRECHLALRWPAHPAWAWVQRLLKQPLASVGSAPPAADATGTAEVLGDRVAVVIDDGPCPFGTPTTVIRVTGNRWEIERPGGVSDRAVEKLALCRLLFICTGNTCRSPMAAALAERLLADRLGCEPADLRRHGFHVQSAGLAAMMGAAAAESAAVAVGEWGADLSGHRSRPLTLELLTASDHVFAMTDSHLRALEGVDVPDLPVARLLSPEGQDVADPIGAEPEVYRACAREILGHLRRRLPEIL
jgi:protein-tyrosine phosphatase